jgi:hypothetical protein
MPRKADKFAKHVRRYLSLDRQIKRRYEERDALIAGVLKDLEPGYRIVVGRETFEFIDRFADATKAWKSTCFHRYEFKKVA